METHGDDLVVCPYCQPPKTHNVKYKTLASHLNKIKKSNPEMKSRRTCKFNVMHFLPEDELERHHAVCPDRRTDEFYDFDFLPPIPAVTQNNDNEDDKTVLPPKPAVFRLNVNLHRTIGGHKPCNTNPQPYEGPRLPVGMVPPVEVQPESRRKIRNVNKSKAFDRSLLH